jgi:enhancing lycopene biosynthesis protein 2
MAPNIDQMHVINHLAGEPAEGETRNVLVESARIARGNIKDIATVTVADFDALILPGGFGAAKNLCDFAVNGPDCSVNPDVARLLKETVAAKKPLAAICIAPALLAKVLGPINSPVLTIGTDQGTAEALNKMGAKHVDCPVKEAVVDRQNRIVSSPAYMLAGSISEAAAGIEKTVQELIAMIE